MKLLGQIAKGVLGWAVCPGVLTVLLQFWLFILNDIFCLFCGDFYFPS